MVRRAPSVFPCQHGGVQHRRPTGGRLDYLVRAREHRLWDREPKRGRGLRVDHKLELCRLLDGPVKMSRCSSMTWIVGGCLHRRLGLEGEVVVGEGVAVPGFVTCAA